MALLLLTIQDQGTEGGVDIKLQSEPPMPTHEGATITPAQALALIAMEAMRKRAEETPEEED